MKNIRNTTGNTVPLCDLKRDPAFVKSELERSIKAVIGRGWYILGGELESFEKEFAAFCGSSYAIGVASGTEALQLALAALSIGVGDEVITPVNTAIPTAMAIIAAGAIPRFVDIREDTFNIDVSKIEKAITSSTRAVMPVHLYGNPCDIKGVLDIAGKHRLFVIEDACQAHGAEFKGRKIGTFGHAAAFSFYPTKNLGCYGDGGIIITDKKTIAAKLKLLRNYGQRTRYVCETQGINSRLDEMQAALLRVKLKYLGRLNERRIEIANLYKRYLKAVSEVILPIHDKDVKHVFHLYVIRCKNRNTLKDYLLKKGIETEIHYPIPLHLQTAFGYLGYKRGDFRVSESAARDILSLPIFPGLRKDEVKRICRAITDFYRREHKNERYPPQAL